MVIRLSVASFRTGVTILIGMTKTFVGPNIGEDCFPLQIGIKDPRLGASLGDKKWD